MFPQVDRVAQQTHCVKETGDQENIRELRL